MQEDRLGREKEGLGLRLRLCVGNAWLLLYTIKGRWNYTITVGWNYTINIRWNYATKIEMEP